MIMSLGWLYMRAPASNAGADMCTNKRRNLRQMIFLLYTDTGEFCQQAAVCVGAVA